MTFLKVCVKNIGLILPLKAGSRIERKLQIFAKSQIQTIFKLRFKIVLWVFYKIFCLKFRYNQTHNNTFPPKIKQNEIITYLVQI